MVFHYFKNKRIIEKISHPSLEPLETRINTGDSSNERFSESLPNLS
jgi:hypothetical protein